MGNIIADGIVIISLIVDIALRIVVIHLNTIVHIIIVDHVVVTRLDLTQNLHQHVLAVDIDHHHIRKWLSLFFERYMQVVFDIQSSPGDSPSSTAPEGPRGADC